ncbi:heparan-alpha-glucosaminide N-acetyltransferase domain-containing protein [Geodermatophilus sp. SYSU D00815]
MDLTRGAALLGMMATHVLDTFDEAGAPTATTVLASGRSAATFATVAGVGIALLSGGRHPVRGRARAATAAGLAVRAVLIAAIGLLLGLTDHVLVILVYYGLLFLLAIPLLGLLPKALAALAAVFLGLGPVLLVALERGGRDAPRHGNPDPVSLLTDPLGVLGQLLVGFYPVVFYAGFLCAGMAVGRLDLGSRRVARRLLGGGVALAVAARVASHLLLHPGGGLERLLAEQPFGATARAEAQLLWNPDQGSSWWYLALAAPHSHTPLDGAHVLGSALAVLGAALLLARWAPTRRLLGPVAAAGTMPLTLYTAHLLVLETDVLEDRPGTLYLLLVGAALVVAVAWRRWLGQGPLERLVAAGSGAARRAVLRPGAVPAA